MSPTYSYRARTAQGEAKAGTRDAVDITTLGRELRDEGMFLVEAYSAHDKEGARLGAGFSLKIRKGIPLVERMLTTRHLAVLLEAGVDLPRALSTLARQTPHPRFRQILQELAQQIRQGRRFSEALASFPKVFPEVYVAMVAAGEESGKLAEALRVLAVQMEKQHRLISRVRGAMMYPAIVTIAMVGIGIAMFIFVVPQLESVFGDLTVKLPLQTRFIFWLSHALIAQWYLFAAGACVVLLLLRLGWASERGRRFRDMLLMRLPFTRSLVREIASAQLARTLSSLVAAGVPIVRGLEITAKVVGNSAFRISLVAAASEIARGKKINETLAQYGDIYPPLVLEMIAVGEESGKLTEVFNNLALFYEEEVDQRTQALATIIEPVMMIVIGAVVGFFVISIMQPMYSLIDTL